MPDLENRLGLKIWIVLLAACTVPCVGVALLYAIDASYIHWLKGRHWGSFVSPHNASLVLVLASVAGCVALLVVVPLSWGMGWKKRGVSSRVPLVWCGSLLASLILFVPSSTQYLAIAVLLLGRGEHSEYFQTMAAVKDSTMLLDALIYRNVPIDDSLLGVAAKFDSPSVIRSLVRHGAPVNLRDADEATAMHYAVAARQYRSVEALLEAGASLDIADARGMTPLDVATTLRDERMVGILKSSKGPIDQALHKPS